MVRRVDAILNASLLLAAVCGAGAVQQPLSDDPAAKGPSNQANPAPERPPASQSAPAAAQLPAVQSSNGSTAPLLPATSAFNSSFDATHPAEPKVPDLDISKSVDLTPTGGHDGVPEVLPAASSADSRQGAIPGWAWFAMIALGVIVAAAMRALATRSSRDSATALISTWLAPRCPYCQNPIARASSRRSALESWVLPLLLIAPVRCLECRRRYYSLVFFARGSGVRNS